MTANSVPDINPADAMYLFESIKFSTTPIVINVSSVATARGPDTKANTVAKRLNIIKHKYGLNLNCTTVGGNDSSTPVTPQKARVGRAATSTSASKNKDSVLGGRVTKNKAYGGGSNTNNNLIKVKKENALAFELNHKTKIKGEPGEDYEDNNNGGSLARSLGDDDNADESEERVKEEVDASSDEL